MATVSPKFGSVAITRDVIPVNCSQLMKAWPQPPADSQTLKPTEGAWMNRRHAFATTIALCHLPVATAQTDPQREAQTRKAIETYARAWEKGDIPSLLNCYHPDFTLNYFGRNALAGRHRGKAASVRVLGEMRQRTDRKLVAISSLLVGGDRAAMITRESLTAKGQSVEIERLYIFTVASDQLLECWVYDQDQRQLDELIGA